MQEMQETQVWFLGQEDPLEEEVATPLQYPCLENPMGRRAQRATIHGVISGTQLSMHTAQIIVINCVIIL